MKFSRKLFAVTLLASAPLAHGQATLTWDQPNANNNWNTTDANWTGGAIFATNDNVIFNSATGETVAVAVGGVTSGTMTVGANNGSWVFTGGSITGTTYTKTGSGTVDFLSAASFSGGLSIGSGFTSTTTASIGNAQSSQTGTLAALELYSLTSDIYNLTGNITLTNTGSGNMLAFGGIGSGVNAAKTLTNNITLSASAVQSRFVILGDANTNTAQAGKHDVILSGKISGGISGATFFINTDQGSTSASSIKLTNATNDFIAAIQVNRGGLAITSDAALGNSANNVTIDSNNTNGGLRFDAALTSARTFTFTVNEAVDTNGNDVTLSGIIAGGGLITKKSAGTLTLSGSSANTFTNTLTISAGTVRLGKASALGTSAGGTIVSSGAVLDLNAQTIGSEAVTLNGTGISAGGALVNSSATAASLSGAVTLASNASIGGTGNITLSGTISGAFALTKVGAGTLTLSNSSNNQASTTLSAGTLSLGNVAALGSGQLTHAGGTLSTTGLTASIVISNAIALSGTGDRTLLMHGIGNGSNTVEYSGQITGSASRLFLNNNQGASTNPQFILSNSTNSFTANILINRGGLRIASNGALGNLANTVTFDSNNGADLTFLNAMTYTRATTISTATDFDTGSNAVTASGVISGGAAFSKLGGGTLTLTGANTYTGTTTIAAGTVSASNIVVSGGSSHLGNATSAVTLGSAAATGTLTYTGNSATFTRGFILGGTGGGRLDVTTAGETLTLSTGGISGAGLMTVSGNGNTTINANITHSGGLTKEGNGVLLLTGINSYSGATTINGGTLAVSGTGSLASDSIVIGLNSTFDVSGVTGGYTLASGKTISGMGTIVGPATIAGILAPGNSPGDLNFADDLSLLGTLNLEVTGLGPLAFDRLIGDGANTLFLGGILNLDNTGYTAAFGDTITVFENWSTILGSFTSINGTDLGGGLSWDTSRLQSSGVLTVIPETSTSLLSGISMLLMLRRRRA